MLLLSLLLLLMLLQMIRKLVVLVLTQLSNSPLPPTPISCAVIIISVTILITIVETSNIWDFVAFAADDGDAWLPRYLLIELIIASRVRHRLSLPSSLSFLLSFVSPFTSVPSSPATRHLFHFLIASPLLLSFLIIQNLCPFLNLFLSSISLSFFNYIPSIPFFPNYTEPQSLS